MAKYLTQPQTVERLSGWQGGSQGKAAKEKAKGVEKQDKSEIGKSQFLQQKALGQHSTEFEYTPSGWNCMNLTNFVRELQNREKKDNLAT